MGHSSSAVLTSVCVACSAVGAEMTKKQQGGEWEPPVFSRDCSVASLLAACGSPLAIGGGPKVLPYLRST